MRVLVTRPEPGASRTAVRLEAAGHEALVMPLTEIIGVPVKGADLPAADAIVITSANALRFAPRALLPSFASVPLLAVGGRTAAAAQAAGFISVTEGKGDAEALAGLIVSRLPAGASVLYLCGRVRRPDFESALNRAGFSVNPVETYDVSLIGYSDDEVRQTVGSEAVDAVLLYSAVAADAYRDLALRHDDLFGSARVLCLSRRIAEAFGTGVGTEIRVAAAPDEASLFALLGA